MINTELLKSYSMYSYSAYGLDIHSQIHLPELTMSASSKADVVIKWGEVDPFSEEALNEGPYFRETEKATYRFWDNVGQFKISNGNEIVIEPFKEVEETLLRLFILGTIFANLLHQRGFLVLHASAVNINNSAVAFLGDKNQGKSTTAFEFYKKGYPVVADDYIPIHFENNIPLIYSGFPQLKLSSEAIENSGLVFGKKINYSSEIGELYVPTKRSFEYTKLPLTNLYILKKDFKNSISPLKSQGSFIELTKNNYGIRRYNRSDSKRCFFQCEKLIRNVRIGQLKLGGLESIHRVVNLVEEEIFNDYDK